MVLLLMVLASDADGVCIDGVQGGFIMALGYFGIFIRCRGV